MLEAKNLFLILINFNNYLVKFLKVIHSKEQLNINRVSGLS